METTELFIWGSEALTDIKTIFSGDDHHLRTVLWGRKRPECSQIIVQLCHNFVKRAPEIVAAIGVGNSLWRASYARQIQNPKDHIETEENKSK